MKTADGELMPTKIDIVHLITLARRLNNEQLTQLVKEYKEGLFEVV
jgi:hypothetical protein